MKIFSLVLASLFVGLSLSANDSLDNYQVILKNGASITAPLIRQNDKGIILDMGDDVLRLAKSAYTSLAKLEAKKINTNSDQIRDIYALGTRANAPVKELVNRVGESVIMVKTPNGLGSGLIISDKGYLLTNYHVVERETRITVTIYKKNATGYEKSELKKVKIIALQPHRDLALLKLDDEETKDLKLKPVVFSNELKVNPGNLIFAIGSPLGLERTVTQGIVSSNMRNIGHLRFIQTDTAINPGNSGGPIFNARGEVIGMVCAGSTQFQGLGFGIPVRDILNFLDHRSAYLYDSSQPQNGILYHTPPFISKIPPEKSNEVP
jgi:serine protease Do